MTQAAANKNADLLLQYALAAGKLQNQLERICANKQEVAASLGRAVAALRSMAAVRQVSK